MRKRILFLIVLCLWGGICLGKERISRGIVKRTFVPKGQWFFGGSCSYSENSQDSYKFLVLKSWSGGGYQLAVKPFFGYMVKDDLGIGANFAYERTLFKIDNLDLNLSEDLQFSVKDYYILEHVYTASAFMRIFMNIEDSKRFGLFNDVKLMFGGGQGKYINGKGDALEGTYQNILKLGLVYSPGIIVFINDYSAVEASVGMLGLQMKHIDQKTNQVYTGSYKTSSANFKIDLFSIGLGVSFYL